MKEAEEVERRKARGEHDDEETKEQEEEEEKEDWEIEQENGGKPIKENQVRTGGLGWDGLSKILPL